MSFHRLYESNGPLDEPDITFSVTVEGARIVAVALRIANDAARAVLDDPEEVEMFTGEDWQFAGMTEMAAQFWSELADSLDERAKDAQALDDEWNVDAEEDGIS